MFEISEDQIVFDTFVYFFVENIYYRSFWAYTYNKKNFLEDDLCHKQARI